MHHQVEGIYDIEHSVFETRIIGGSALEIDVRMSLARMLHHLLAGIERMRRIPGETPSSACHLQTQGSGRTVNQNVQHTPLLVIYKTAVTVVKAVFVVTVCD